MYKKLPFSFKLSRRDSLTVHCQLSTVNYCCLAAKLTNDNLWKIQKNMGKVKPFPCFFVRKLAVGTHLSEALAAENGTIGLGLEGHLGLAAAACTGSGEELTGTTSVVLASVTAGLAALGLILEAALCVELLLTGGEHELLAAILAN